MLATVGQALRTDKGVRSCRTADRLLEMDVSDLVPQDFSVTHDKIVFNQGEITGNIWMTETR